MSCKEELMKVEDMKVNVKIAGNQIELVPFVHDAMRDVIIAFTNNLKGHDGGRIEIVIE